MLSVSPGVALRLDGEMAKRQGKGGWRVGEGDSFWKEEP